MLFRRYRSSGRVAYKAKHVAMGVVRHEVLPRRPIEQHLNISIHSPACASIECDDTVNELHALGVEGANRYHECRSLRARSAHFNLNGWSPIEQHHRRGALELRIIKV
jgi:hypothetical protein